MMMAPQISWAVHANKAVSATLAIPGLDQYGAYIRQVRPPNT